MKRKGVNKKKNFDISKIIIFFCILLLILLLVFFLVPKSIVPKLSPLDSAGLPSDFTPFVGYYNLLGGVYVSLWNSAGDVYVKPNEGSWEVVSRTELATLGLPTNFVPTMGYYHYFYPNATSTDEQVSLWNSNTGYTFSLKENKWTLIDRDVEAIKGLPKAFMPVAGVYHYNLEDSKGYAGGKLVLWDAAANMFIFNQTAWLNLGKQLGPIPPKIAINYDDTSTSSKGLYFLFNVNNNLRVFNSSKSVGFSESTSYITGLPSGIPTTGYYDHANKSIVLWYGQKAYASPANDRLNYKLFIDLAGTTPCTPGALVCGEWGSCIEGAKTRSCFDNCDTITESTMCSIQCTPASTNICQDRVCGSIQNGTCGEAFCGSGCSGIEVCSSSGQCIQQSCFDSNADEILPFYTFGNITYTLNDVLITKNNSCKDANILIEWSCDGNIGQNQTWSCSHGCSNGKCSGEPTITCDDSDGGKIFGVLGKVNVTLDSQSQILSDICVDSTTLGEYYCTANSEPDYFVHNCAIGETCSNGICSSGGIVINTTGEGCIIDGCDGDYFLACENGQYLSPVHIEGQCGYTLIIINTNTTTDPLEPQVEGGSNVWIWVIVILVIVILIVGGIVAFVIWKKQQDEGSKSSAPKSPPSGPGRTITQTPQRIFERPSA
ncbi:MAG: hypothetical protein WC781_04445 [Candidatus Pacearchaeota archaeon]|jgi:flagellar basal body-associated protein FliL